MIPIKIKEYLDNYIHQEVYVQIAVIKGKEKASTKSAINSYFNSNHFRDLSEGRPYDHFIDGLNEKVLTNFKIRAYQKAIWNTRLMYSDKYGEDTIAITKTLHQDYSQSKLIICSYPQTTFSEAMYSGAPTILLYIEQYWETSPDFDSLILELKKAGIIYSDPGEAATHVNNICNNPMEWWNKKETIRARNMFFDMCVKVSSDPVVEWSNFFKNTLK